MLPSCFRRREGRGLQQCYKPRIRPVSPVETMPECQASCECLWRKMVGKPYSGKPNVRIDEGELEIERSATTPALYSTTTRSSPSSSKTIMCSKDASWRRCSLFGSGSRLRVLSSREEVVFRSANLYWENLRMESDPNPAIILSVQAGKI